MILILFLLISSLAADAAACEGCFLSEALAAEDMAAAGQRVYRRYCIGCHGEKGNGKGKGAALLVVKPRDFTSGTFKFKSTPTGSLPTDEDIMRTLIHGLPGSSMPAFPLLPESERRAMIAYIKTFSGRWVKEKPGLPLAIPSAPDYVRTLESVNKGKELYTSNGCNICHGDTGDGKGPASDSMTDSWNSPVRPRNFKRGIYRSGTSPEDIFRVLSAGVEGTPMPGFFYLSEDDRWHIVSYLLSLKGGKR